MGLTRSQATEQTRQVCCWAEGKEKSKTAPFPQKFRLHFAPELSTEKASLRCGTWDFQLSGPASHWNTQQNTQQNAQHSPFGSPAFMGSPVEVTFQGLPAQPGPGQGELGCREQSTGLGWQTIFKENYRDFRVKYCKTILHMFWTYLDMYFKRIATDKKAYFRQTHVVISQAEHMINSQEPEPCVVFSANIHGFFI